MGCLLKRIPPPKESLMWPDQLGTDPPTQKVKILVKIVQFNSDVEGKITELEFADRDELDTFDFIRQGPQSMTN
jgi:hypothetical protein